MQKRAKANANANGFTIVELLIVIVVIGILAAITIVAFNGVTQKASGAALTSAVNQWVKIIQTTSAGSSFKFNGNTCLGASINDFPAENGFAAGSCVLNDGSNIVSFVTSSFSTFPSSQARPTGKLSVNQVTISGSTVKGRGIWVANYSDSGVELRWVANGPCTVGSSIGSDSNSNLCSYLINYP